MFKAGDLLLVGEVAHECRASVSTVRFWIRTGKLRSLRPGRRRLVRRGDLELFLQSTASGASSAETPGAADLVIGTP